MNSSSGIGVDHRYAGSGTFKMRTLPNWNRPVCNQSELGDGQMLLACIGTKAVSSGVIISTYRPNGPLRTGSFRRRGEVS